MFWADYNQTNQPPPNNLGTSPTNSQHNDQTTPHVPHVSKGQPALGNSIILISKERGKGKSGSEGWI